MGREGEEEKRRTEEKEGKRGEGEIWRRIEEERREK